MKTFPRRYLSPVLRRGAFLPLFALAFLFACLAPRPLGAQNQANGTIEGRVFNTTSGEYVENARLTIEGTNRETLSDSGGFYRFASVPAGAVRVRVFYTGLAVQTERVAVVAGQVVPRDFSLGATSRTTVSDPASGTVKLSEFIVGASKEMTGSAIAINEQRFASNILNVVSADEFGHVAEGNVGEFLKFVPGVSMDSGGGVARAISVGGASPENTPVTIGGFSVASASSGGNLRRVELEQISINNMSRIEVYHSPTPESPGSALAGGVNMVPRSAFERSKPAFNWSTFMMFRDAEKQLHRTPGPLNQETYKIHPGFDFSWIMPVNKRFGFTVSGAHSDQYTLQDNFTNNWRGAGAGTNAPSIVNGVSVPGALPDTTPDKPYLTNYTLSDGNFPSTRSSIGATADFKLTRNDTLSFSIQYAQFYSDFNNRSLSFNINRVLPGNFDITRTQGDINQGTLTNNASGAEKSGTTYAPSLVWRHVGPVWRADFGLSHSGATNHYRDNDKGHFRSANTQRTDVTVGFAGVTAIRPGTISVTEGAVRTPVDPWNLNSYVINSATVQPTDGQDLQRAVQGNLAREFAVAGQPFTLKAGASIQQWARDMRGRFDTYTWVGPDKIRTTTPSTAGSDDGAGMIFDSVFSQRFAPWGFPRVGWPDGYKLWEIYKAHPEYFTRDFNTDYRNEVQRSKYVAEVVSAGFLRADTSLFGGRLKLVGGVRAEQTNVNAYGLLSDPTLNYRRDTAGNVIPQRDATGNIIFTGTGANRVPMPTLIEPLTRPNPAGGAPISNALAISKLTYLDRGAHIQKEYLRFFPSLNASFNLRENLILRGAVYQSVGRPPIDQYAGGLTLPDTEQPPSPTTNRITVNNAGIKAWSANTVKIRAEYYFEQVGNISIGGFRRHYQNLFGSQVFQATPDFLSYYSLDPDTFSDYYVSTNYNLPGVVRMEGMEFDYKQVLTFLPHWARGVQVFANATAIRVTGDATASFTDFVPRVYNWGISLTRPRFNVRMNWNDRGRRRLSPIAESPRSIEPGTFNWRGKALYVDLKGEYNFTPRMAVFLSIRNLANAVEQPERFGPNTPAVARINSVTDFAQLWTIGIRGSY